MGYSIDWRAKVLTSAMLGYIRILKQETEGAPNRNRKGQATLTKKRFMKLLGN